MSSNEVSATNKLSLTPLVTPPSAAKRKREDDQDKSNNNENRLLNHQTTQGKLDLSDDADSLSSSSSGSDDNSNSNKASSLSRPIQKNPIRLVSGEDTSTSLTTEDDDTASNRQQQQRQPTGIADSPIPDADPARRLYPRFLLWTRLTQATTLACNLA